MCLYVERGEKIRTATKDIVVWKILDTTETKGHYVSPFYFFEYFRGREYKPVKLRVKRDYWRNSRIVERGFHAYRSYNSALSRAVCNEIVKMIVPKGSEYILGTNNEIVSSHIKFPAS